jgi:hypothetical protein
MKASCTVGKYLETAPKEDAEALVAALDADATLQRISESLHSFGVTLSAYTLSRHKRGICRCDSSPTPPPAGTLSEALNGLRG